MTDQKKILEACARHYATFVSDCSGFVRAVATDVGYNLEGNADMITKYIDKNWIVIADGAAAEAAAASGALVIAAQTGKDHVPPHRHGHVVVVIAGTPLYHGRYPMCWGGSIGKYPSKGNKSVGQVWGTKSRDSVIYRKAPGS